jgi:hypothetical protein
MVNLKRKRVGLEDADFSQTDSNSAKQTFQNASDETKEEIVW